MLFSIFAEIRLLSPINQVFSIPAPARKDVVVFLTNGQPPSAFVNFI